MTFKPEDILYEDNHILAVNKRAGQLVQPDTTGDAALEEELKTYLKVRDAKPGNVFLGVVHRIDRPVSGAILFAKTSKALARMNEMMKSRSFRKIYWAITECCPEKPEDTLREQLARNGKTNKSYIVSHPTADSKEAVLHYRTLGNSTRYTLLEVELMTGRHHQIRCQLAHMGCPIRGDLKYGAARSNRDGSISLHSREITFIHPVSKVEICVTAPANTEDTLWRYFEENF